MTRRASKYSEEDALNSPWYLLEHCIFREFSAVGPKETEKRMASTLCCSPGDEGAELEPMANKPA